jgi:hypothetical protein
MGSKATPKGTYTFLAQGILSAQTVKASGTMSSARMQVEPLGKAPAN